MLTWPLGIHFSFFLFYTQRIWAPNLSLFLLKKIDRIRIKHAFYKPLTEKSWELLSGHYSIFKNISLCVKSYSHNVITLIFRCARVSLWTSTQYTYIHGVTSKLEEQRSWNSLVDVWEQHRYVGWLEGEETSWSERWETLLTLSHSWNVTPSCVSLPTCSNDFNAHLTIFLPLFTHLFFILLQDIFLVWMGWCWKVSKLVFKGDLKYQRVVS